MPARPKRTWHSWVFPILLFVALIGGQYFSSREIKRPAIAYSDFFHFVSEGKVKSATIKGQSLVGAFSSPQTVEGKSTAAFTTTLPTQEDRDLLPVLRQKNVQLTIKSEEQPIVVQVLLAALPWVIILGGWVWI